MRPSTVKTPTPPCSSAEVLATMGDDMIYKEEKILFPMAMDNLAE